MNLGLRPQDLSEIIQILQAFPAIDEAVVFGSRAKGNYKKGSDIDLAIKGADIDYEVVATLSFLLNEESSTPYFFDIVHWETISEQALRDHIRRVGKSIYSRSGAQPGGLNCSTKP